MIHWLHGMKYRNIQSIICLGIILLSVHTAWTEDWRYYDTANVGDMYYDKSGIRNAGKNIVSVRTKCILNEQGKAKYYTVLKSLNKTPDNASRLSYSITLMELDYTNKKIRDMSLVFYDDAGHAAYSSPLDDPSDWAEIAPDTIGAKLFNLVSWEPFLPLEGAASRGAEKPAPPAKALNAAAPPDHKEANRLTGKVNAAKKSPEAAVQNLVMKWISSRQSGKMDSYRNCYAPDFESNGEKLDAWIRSKSKERRRDKEVSIQIDLLKVSVKDKTATAKFVEFYSTSLVKDSKFKKLELKIIKNQWKIYRENTYN
jgi:hypothetical protein